MSINKVGPWDQIAQPKKLSRQEEIELTRRVVDGDDSAWEQLYKSNVQIWTGILAGATGRPADAEDLANMCMSEAYFLVKKNKYNPQYRFSTFLRVISGNVLSRYYRKLRREPTFMSMPEGVEHVDPSGSTEPDESPLCGIVEHTMPLLEDRMDIMNEMFYLVFQCCSKPHKIIAFCFDKLLEWTPKRLVNDLIDEKTVGQLGDRLCRDYFEETEPPCSFEQFQETTFGGLYEKLEKRFREVYVEPEYGLLRKQYDECKVKDVPFQEFFTRANRAACISEWCQNVRNRAQYAVREGKPCTRNRPPVRDREEIEKD